MLKLRLREIKWFVSDYQADNQLVHGNIANTRVYS